MKNIPSIRFKDFNNNWEEEKLYNLAEFRKGQGYSKNDISEDGYPLYLYGQMYTDYKFQINENKTFTSEIKPNSVLSKGNEVIIPSSGETAEDLARASHLNIKDVIIGGDLNIIYPNELLNSDFLALIITYSKVNKFLASRAQGKSVVHLHNSDIKELDIPIPDIEEQSHIGNLFKNIDGLIENQDSMVDSLKSYKKSMLQKMFPSGEKSVPEIRFSGFSGDWEEVLIKSVAKIKTGESNTQDATDDGEYPFYIRSEVPLRSDKFLYDEEAVLTIGDGKIGKVFFYVNGKYDLHQRVYRIYDFNEILNGLYFYYNFSTFFLRRAMSLSAKATVDSVRMEMISDMNIKIPSLPEQEKIGNFFKNLDLKISNEESLLTSYKSMKKSLLQKMFI